MHISLNNEILVCLFSSRILRFMKIKNLGKLGKPLVGASPGLLPLFLPRAIPLPREDVIMDQRQLQPVLYQLHPAGLPGLQESRALLVLPLPQHLPGDRLCQRPLVIHMVVAQRSLHQPMYLLIALLLLSTSVPPAPWCSAMLLSFLLPIQPHLPARCLVQMFCIYFLIVFDQHLLVMAPGPLCCHLPPLSATQR